MDSYTTVTLILFNPLFLFHSPPLPPTHAHLPFPLSLSLSLSPSPSLTDSSGYKMCIRAYLNGDGIGYKTHFSVFFVLTRGEFDPLLKWPFEYKVRLRARTHACTPNHALLYKYHKHIVQTFKPTPGSSSFKRPTTDMNVASGTVECSHTYYIQCCIRNVHVFLFLTPLPLPLCVTIDTYMYIVYVQ